MSPHRRASRPQNKRQRRHALLPPRPPHDRHGSSAGSLTPLLYERLAPELCFDLRIVLPEDDFLLLAFFLGLDEEVVVVVFRFPPAIWMIC